MNHILLTIIRGNGNKNYYIVRSPIPIQVGLLAIHYEKYIREHGGSEMLVHRMLQHGKKLMDDQFIQNNTIVYSVTTPQEEKQEVEEKSDDQYTFYELSYPISLSTYEVISELEEENESFVITMKEMLPQTLFEDVAFIKNWLLIRKKLIKLAFKSYDTLISERWYASYHSLTTIDKENIFSILTPIEKRRFIIFQLINKLPTYLSIEQKYKALLESLLDLSERTPESVEYITRYSTELQKIKEKEPTIPLINQLVILTLDEWTQRDIDISLEKLEKTSAIDLSNAYQATHVQLLPDAHTMILYVYGHGCDSNESFRDLIGPEFYTQINPILLYESPGYECVNYTTDKDDDDLENVRKIVSSRPLTDSVPKLVSHAMDHQAYQAKKITLYSSLDKSTFEDDYLQQLSFYALRERLRREKYLLRPGRNHRYEFYNKFNRSLDSIDEPERTTEEYKRSKRGIYLLYHDLPISLQVKENLLHPTSTPYLSPNIIHKDIPVIDLVTIYKKIYEWYKSTISPDSKLNVLIYDKSCRVPCLQIVPASPPLIRTPSFEASSLGKKHSKKRGKQCKNSKRKCRM